MASKEYYEITDNNIEVWGTYNITGGENIIQIQLLVFVRYSFKLL